jgi:hypothetical protein
MPNNHLASPGATIVPTSLAILQHASDSGTQVRLVAHLRSGLNTFRQHNSQWMSWEAAQGWLALWVEDREEVMARLFGWRPADVDAAIRTAPRATERRSPARPMSGLTLADLGL